jgi:hypothetical protein
MTAATKPRKSGKPAFAKKGQPPTEAEFIARLPLPVGKRFESLRGFLKKHESVSEELYYFGPKTGWAWRYLRGATSLCSVMIHDGNLVGIVALDAAAQRAVGWDALSPAGQKARKRAHGTPALLWLDLPFDGTGAGDFKTILKAKLKTLS